MATVTLISVIEDEFHVEIPATEMEKLVSFEGFLKVLTDATVNSASKEICKTVSVGTQPRRLGDSRSTHERS
jgi:acyl carrier protein